MKYNHTILKANLNKNGKTKILLRVNADKVRYFPVTYNNQDIYVTPKEFKSIGRNIEFKEVSKFLNGELDRVKDILSKGKFSWSMFEKHYYSSIMLSDCFQEKIDELLTDKKYSSANSYNAAMESFKQFDDVKISDVDSEWIKSYVDTTGNGSTYLRYLRHICKRQGVKFDYKVSTRSKMTIPLTEKDIRKIIWFKGDERLEVARDLFLLSYYGGGMNTKDWLYLKRSEIINDVIFKQRAKTSMPTVVPISDDMRKIIDKYDSGDSEWIFPFLDGDTDEQVYRSYKKFFDMYSKSLRMLQSRLGIETKITPYVARYTHAAILRSRGVSLEDAQESMSHRDMSSTRVYWGMMGMDKRRELQRLLCV